MLTPTSYRIPVEALSSGSAATRLARAWLMLGVAALIGSGLLAVLLVLARTPGLQGFLPSRQGPNG